MEGSDKRLPEFVDVVKVPRKPELSNVSRDFWMPDHSCRVCYECDSQFTVFNRRHHCRICGRIFCAKCTTNTVPVSCEERKSLREEGERVRVCNYCFKRWEQDLVVAENGVQTGLVVPSPVLSPSVSTISLVSSTKSSGTGNSSSSTAGSTSHSTGGYHHAPYGSGPSRSQSIRMECQPDKLDKSMSNTDSVVDIGDLCPHQFGFCMNRSDDEDDEYGAHRLDSETQRFQISDEYYGPGFEEIGQGYRSNKVYPAEESIDAKEVYSPRDNAEFHASLGLDKLPEGAGNDNNYECDASSTIYGMEDSEMEPVDFENNGLLWLPPMPADEEDEREHALFDDDDDGDATGEWGYMRSSKSFGSGEYRSRDRLNEEHKKVMKNVVDGHFRALVAQLLQVENLPMDEEENTDSWLEIITSLSWEAATLLKPDTSKGGGMDPGGYVKVKCIACGRRSESMVVRGVVCKKNVAHRRMSAKIEKPRFLILGGALEYQRVTNMLSSVDTLLQQEMDHLKMAVAKIAAHHPSVLLVEKSVSRFAQDYLLTKNISLVLNIKRPLLERIARCTNAQVVPSIDHLSSQKLGNCDLFHVEKFFEEHGSAGQGGKKMIKTLMFFEGCPKPLGCTVLLKGASGDELKKIKHVVQYGVFAAYHLALETSFLADEGASLPELPLKSPIIVALPDKPSGIDRSISTIPGFIIPAADKPQLNNHVRSLKTSDPMLASGNFGNMEVTAPPSLMSPSGESHGMNGYLMGKDNWAKHFMQQQSTAAITSPSPDYSSTFCQKEKNQIDFLEHFGVESFKSDDQTVDNLASLERDGGRTNATQLDHRQIIDKQPGLFDLGISHQDDNQKDDRASLKEDFPPSSDHQSILVSLSSRCVWKGTVCERAHLLRIKYYGSFDKPLGRFLREHLFDESYRCRSCEMPSEAHVHCYTHRQGSLTISVRKLPEFLLTGEKDGKIWMWHRCLRCPRINGFPPATQRVVMSDAAWGLSFGKFLELSFSNNAAASRVASCGHSLHRDCLRFYGFGRMVACFRYAAVNLNSVYLPPSKLDFNHQHQEWVQKEADEVAEKAELLFSEILNKLRQITERRLSTGSPHNDVKVSEPKCNVVELEGMLQKEKAEFEEYLHKVVKKDVLRGKPVIDILEINKLRRQLLFLSYFWDQRLVFAASSDHSRHDVLRGLLARSKGKLSPTENLVDLNLSPKTLKGFCSLDSPSSDFRSNEPLKGHMHLIDHQERPLDHLNQNHVCQEKIDVVQDPSHTKQGKVPLSTTFSAINQLDPLESGFVVHRVLSDREFPIMEDISDTLDAKWIGGNGPALAEVSIPNSHASMEATSAVSVSTEDSKEWSGGDLTRSFSSALPIRLRDVAEDSSTWGTLAFLNFYRLVNKTPKFDVLNEYNPVYVSLFRELDCQGGARLHLPVGVNDTVIPVYDDEPTSIIAYALVSLDYHLQLSDEQERTRDTGDSTLPTHGSGIFHPFQLVADISSESSKSIGSTDDSLRSMSGSRSSLGLDPLTYTKAMHVRVSFSDDGPLGKVKYTVTCYYAKHFDALRRTCCPSELDFIRSLSRCKKWGAQGGKSNVFFAKSLDDRFIIKQVTKTELESFIKFAPEYFKYLSESINTRSPTCLAKILGIYQVITKHLKGGKESRMDILVMENLLFGRTLTRLYDLKGSSRSRYNSDSSGNNRVLLDQNLIEAMPTSPIFVGNKAKRLLERAVWNDTAFLASIDVMDYSLLVGIDEEKHELVLGIIDFMRQYTWDKHLETWVKTSGILGGPKNASPTVISPMQYKKRFRKAMSAYFLVVPDQWRPPTIIPSKSQSDLCEDNQQSASVQS